MSDNEGGFNAILNLMVHHTVQVLPNGRACLMDFSGILTPDQAKPIIDALRAFYDNPDNELIATVNAKPEPVKQSGFVYLLKWGNEYKIGFTRQSVETRQKAIQKETGRMTECVCAIETDEPEQLEARLHSRFASKWLWQEWYALRPRD